MDNRIGKTIYFYEKSQTLRGIDEFVVGKITYEKDSVSYFSEKEKHLIIKISNSKTTLCRFNSYYDKWSESDCVASFNKCEIEQDIAKFIVKRCKAEINQKQQEILDLWEEIRENNKIIFN